MRRSTRKRAGFTPRHSAAVCVVQRFGSDPNLTVFVLDGVYTDTSSGRSTFHHAPPPTDEEIAHFLRRIRNRALHHLERAKWRVTA